jgi:broad specificity phosphatase PhoE
VRISVTQTLHLVRHGLSAPTAGPASEWDLHPDAHVGLAALRRSGVLPADARWFTSPEPKAHGTARALTDTAVGVVDGLREMARPAEPWHGAETWNAVVHRSMTQPDTPARPGWETARATADRVAGAVRRIQDSCPDDDLVLVGHGTAWTLLVATLTQRPPDVEAWQRMRMPDHCALRLGSDSTTAQLVDDWGAWAA